MTDTADIKALRDAAALIAHGYKQRWGCETNEDTGFVGIGTFDHDGELCPFIEVSVSNWSDDNGDDERLAEFLTLANPLAILALLDQLEAERQRADDAERAGDDARKSRDLHHKVSTGLNERLIKAEAELAALKGDQVPVALIDERQGSGGFCLTQHGRRLNLQHGTELFTAPQKPVGLRQIGSIDHDGGAFAEHFVELTDSAQVGQAVYVIDEAIEADGGIVKDGE